MRGDFERTFSRRRWLRSLGAASAIGLLGAGSATAERSVGNGGYHTGPPGDARHEYGRHTTSNFGDRPIPTNDWYSAIPLEGITGSDAGLVAHPLIFNTTTDGLAVGHPMEWTTSWDEADQTGSASMDTETQLSVSHGDDGRYDDVRLDDHGDWSATALFGEGSPRSLRVTMAQGSPFVFCELGGGGGVTVEFDGDMSLFENGGTVLGVAVDDRKYGLYGPAGRDWSVSGATVRSEAEYCAVAILPEEAYLDTYESYAYNRITDTVFEWDYDESTATVRSTFRFETESRPESAESGTVTALYPHQWKDAEVGDEDGTYPSSRGEMRITTGETVTVSYDYGGVLPVLPPEGEYDPDRLEALVGGTDERFTGGVVRDTYGFGREAASRLGRVAAVADQVGLDDKRDALLDTIRDGLEEWFTPSDRATFYYDETIGVLQGVPGSHGSVTEVNDHHFHFGHFVWASARIARHDPEWAATDNWGGMVEELIADYANPDRDSDRYPFNRNFSVYAGHAWAHGSGAFPSGNNQESSSEAMMSYAALIQWGSYTGNRRLRDFGIVLYAIHRRAIQEYWYDIDRENFPADWEADMAGMVWGNHVAHATWWTTDSEAVYGINMLPLSGFSMYLGRDDALAERSFRRVEERKGGTFDYWPDIMWMYRAFSDPDDAIARFENRADSYDGEQTQEKSHTLYWLYAMASLGSPEGGVTADTPFYQVFDDGSERTYVAYNSASETRTVAFSDGMELDVPGDSLVAETGNGGESPTDRTDTPPQTETDAPPRTETDAPPRTETDAPPRTETATRTPDHTPTGTETDGRETDQMGRGENSTEPPSQETPGFGVGTALAGIGSGAYLLRRRLESGDDEE